MIWRRNAKNEMFYLTTIRSKLLLLFSWFGSFCTFFPLYEYICEKKVRIQNENITFTGKMIMKWINVFIYLFIYLLSILLAYDLRKNSAVAQFITLHSFFFFFSFVAVIGIHHKSLTKIVDWAKQTNGSKISIIIYTISFISNCNCSPLPMKLCGIERIFNANISIFFFYFITFYKNKQKQITFFLFIALKNYYIIPPGVTVPIPSSSALLTAEIPDHIWNSV